MSLHNRRDLMPGEAPLVGKRAITAWLKDMNRERLAPAS